VLSKENASPPGKGLEKGIKAIQSPKTIKSVPEINKKLCFFTAR